MAIGPIKKGALHAALHIAKGKKLTEAQEEVKEGDSPLMKKRKIFAQNAKKWHHKGNGMAKAMRGA